jgi:hypothetical protein
MAAACVLPEIVEKPLVISTKRMAQGVATTIAQISPNLN